MSVRKVSLFSFWVNHVYLSVRTLYHKSVPWVVRRSYAPSNSWSQRHLWHLVTRPPEAAECTWSARRWCVSAPANSLCCTCCVRAPLRRSVCRLWWRVSWGLWPGCGWKDLKQKWSRIIYCLFFQFNRPTFQTSNKTTIQNKEQGSY